MQSSSSSCDFQAADGDLVSPDSVNSYLQSILMPAQYGKVPIPDGDPTPVMLKQFSQEFLSSWLNADATLMVVWTPASPNRILKIFVRIPAGPWAWLMDLPLSQPLDQSFNKARLVSARLDVRSGAQAAGVFTLAGMVSGVYTNQMPPFSTLDYNSVISYAPNGGCVARQIPICDGMTSLFPPNRGSQEFFTPETDYSYNFKELWDYHYVGAKGGFAPSPFVLGAGVSLVIWDSASAQAFGYPFGTIPDPLYGNMSIQYVDDGSATALIKFTMKYDYYTADPVTWAPVLNTGILFIGTYPTAPGIAINLDTGVKEIPQNIVRLYLEASAPGAGLTFTRTAGTAPVIRLTSYDYYRPNVMSPVVINMATRVNVGQPMAITGTYNYELVPNPVLARNVTLTTKRNDDINLEGALAVLEHVGSGVQLVWNSRHYDSAVADSTLKSFATGSQAYAAAGPSLKSRLLGLWKTVNPYLSNAAMVGAKAGLGVLGGAVSTAYPALSPAVAALSSQYLASDPDPPHGTQVSQEENGAPFPRYEEPLRLGQPHPHATLQFPKEFLDHVCVNKQGKCPICSYEAANDETEENTNFSAYWAATMVQRHSWYCKPDKCAPGCAYSQKYLAADTESSPVYSEASIGSDFVNIANGTAEPLSTTRMAYFPIVPAADNLKGGSLAVQIAFSRENIGYNYTMQMRVGRTIVHLTHFFDAAKQSFLSSLINYAQLNEVVGDDDLYVSTNSDTLAVSGISWHLAALVAIMGIGGVSLYTGGVEFIDAWTPVIKPVSLLFAKAEVARNLGMKLVFPATCAPTEIQSIQRVGPIIYPGFMCSGLRIPDKVSGLAITSPYDVVLFNMRLMKHRLQMNPYEQQLITPSAEFRQKAVKVVNMELENLKEKYVTRLKENVHKALVKIAEGVGSEHQLYQSVKKKEVAWAGMLRQSGTEAALKLQGAAITAALTKAVTTAQAIADTIKRQDAGRTNKKKQKSSISLAKAKQLKFRPRMQADVDYVVDESGPSNSFEEEAAQMLDM